MKSPSLPRFLHVESRRPDNTAETFGNVTAQIDNAFFQKNSLRLRNLEHMILAELIPKKEQRVYAISSSLVIFILITLIIAIVVIILSYFIPLGPLVVLTPYLTVLQCAFGGLILIVILWRITWHLSTVRLFNKRMAYTLTYVREKCKIIEEETEAHLLNMGSISQADRRRLRLTHLNTEVGSVLVDNEEDRKLANQSSNEAYDSLYKFVTALNLTGTNDSYNNTPLTAEQSKLLSDVDEKIGAIEVRIKRERLLLTEQKNWRNVFLQVIIIYVTLLVLVIVLLPQQRFNETIPNTGIPASIFIWGILGSLGAILYKFYKMDKRVRFQSEFRWLIARPIIGVIMAGLSYLAVFSGLLIANTAVNSSIPTTAPAPTSFATSHMELFWVFAFLAGFSDKFYEGIINILVERTIAKEDQKPTLSATPSSTTDANVVKDIVRTILAEQANRAPYKLEPDISSLPLPPLHVPTNSSSTNGSSPSSPMLATEGNVVFVPVAPMTEALVEPVVENVNGNTDLEENPVPPEVVVKKSTRRGGKIMGK